MASQSQSSRGQLQLRSGASLLTGGGLPSACMQGSVPEAAIEHTVDINFFGCAVVAGWSFPEEPREMPDARGTIQMYGGRYKKLLPLERRAQ